ncbi:MAG: DNA polymerase IV [Chloroflexota bacterium]|nr:DNA polymerase IV [Chloroflexota bacterium]
MDTTNGRSIIHADMDAFYASVEQRDHPEWRGLPLAVGNGTGSRRGVVAAASYEARRFGVRSAIPLWQALERCPNLLVVPANHKLYREVSNAVHAVFRRFTAQIEPIALDEAFLDVTAAAPTIAAATALAADLKAQIRAAVGLTASLGVGSGKMLAKIACDHSKPDGLLAVPAGGEAAFLAPLPVGVVWGIGPKRQAELAARGITTIGQLAALDEDTARVLFGRWGSEVLDLAHGYDPRPVVADRDSKSISSETTFDDPLAVEQDGEIRAILTGLAEEVAASVQAEGFLARCVAVKIKTADFRSQTRQRTLLAPSDQAGVFARAAVAEFHRWCAEQRAADPRRRLRVRLLGVRTADFILPSETRQLSLFEGLLRH